MSNCGSCSTQAIDKKTPRRNIKNVIAIMSGKGGVGKSTVTVLLAKELKKLGYSVGIMDADITGPSIPRLMNISEERITIDDGFMVPIISEAGIKVISLNSVTEIEDEPVVWRGPVIAQAVMQFWNETAWDDLDYLLIDMPPGTGDVPLTVMKEFNLKGLVMVSIPQDMVSMIVTKAIKMARKMNVEILGIIENMSYITCDCCDNKIYMSDEKETDKFLEEIDIELLGELPMIKAISKMSSGKEEYPEEIFKNIARRVTEKTK
ncbi:MAG: sodium:proton antiporter [Fusobacteriales bacterium]|nr:MAG: sodium:proton antiporter [Fusobacteriales bacterium]